MSLSQILRRAQAHVQRGQFHAAFKLYKGLRLTFPDHPQVNTELGVLSLQHGSPQEAIPPLLKALAAQPQTLELWVCLLVAHQRCGHLQRAREVLAEMRQKGFPEQRLALFELELQAPPPERLQAIEQLIAQHSHVSAEIGARLLMADYPDHPAGAALLQKVQRAANQAQADGESDPVALASGS